MKTYKCAGPDGKCYKCDQHCMNCECWLSGIKFVTEQEMQYLKNNQPERSKREDLTGSVVSNYNFITMQG